MGRQNKQTFLDEKIKAKEYFDSKRIGLMLKYGIPYDSKKKYYTQREINEIDEIMIQLEDIDSLKHKDFTPKECGLLIMNGYHIQLRVFLQNAYRSIEYNALKNKLEEIHNGINKNKSTEEGTKAKPRKPVINKKKLAAVRDFVESAGGLNIEEMKVFISLAGYKIENGSLVEKELFIAEEKTEELGL